MERSILKLIDDADENGMYGFTVKKVAVHPDVAARGPNILRELLQSHFCTFTNCVLKTGRTKRWTDGLDATASVDELGDWTVKLNLAKFFRLPAVQPRAELELVRSFFEQMKPFFEEHASSRAVVDLSNRRAKGAVSGAIECRYPVVLGLASTVDLAHTARLRALVDKSPLLQEFLGTVLHVAHAVGPWDFALVNEAMLYGLEDGPAMRRFLEEQRSSPRKYFQLAAEPEPELALA